MRDIDAMLADYDQDHPEDPLAPYGDKPRTDWPSHARWPKADLREREFWIRKLYHEDELATSVVASTLNINRSTVQRVIAELGISRGDGKIGKGTQPARRKAERQAQVRRIFEERQGQVTGAEIARQVDGYSASTIQSDLVEMGLVPVVVRNVHGLDRTVSRVVLQLSEMGEFLLNHPQLHLVAFDSDKANELLKQLTRASRGINRARKYLNKGANQ
jgi:hypothetical protein